MKNLASWTFSDARARVDIPRIIREAEQVLDYQTGELPALIRMTAGGNVYTLFHESNVEGFCFEAPIEHVKRATDAHIGRVGEWVVFAGDFVGEFADRVEVTVEVF
jgi:hypothetical protein